MPRISAWRSGTKGNDYKFIDRNISEFFGFGGTTIFAHMYIGPYLQSSDGSSTGQMTDRNGSVIPAYDPNNPDQTTGGIMSIEDPILLENRDRSYAPNPIELRGIYNINDLDFDLRQFGLFLSNDTLYIEFHLNDMIAQCGRKLIAGDVLELPHRRDTGLDPANQVAANKFYVIEDASRASNGYSVTWWPHIWRVKVSPMPASQEYADILNAPALNPQGLPVNGLGSTPVTVGDIISTIGTDLALNEAVDDQAKIDVPKRYMETRQFYMLTPENPNDYPWVFAGDGIPPNGAVLVGSGTQFPVSPQNDDYYLRTDYHPETLFQWNGSKWTIQETNNRPNWMAAREQLMDFINNDRVTTNADGTTMPEKTNLSRVIAPRADF